MKKDRRLIESNAINTEYLYSAGTDHSCVILLSNANPNPQLSSRKSSPASFRFARHVLVSSCHHFFSFFLFSPSLRFLFVNHNPFILYRFLPSSPRNILHRQSGTGWISTAFHPVLIISRKPLNRPFGHLRRHPAAHKARKTDKKKKKVCSRSFKDTFDLSLSVCVSAVRLMQPPSLSFSRSLHSFFFLPFPPSSLSFLTSFFFPNLSIVIFSPFHSLPTPTSPFSSDPRPCFSSLRKLLLVHCDY